MSAMAHRTTREGGGEGGGEGGRDHHLAAKREGQLFASSCLGRGHPNQRKALVRDLPKGNKHTAVLPAFRVARAQATKPQRGLGKLPATLLAKAVIIITPASELLFLSGVLGWNGCGKA